MGREQKKSRAGGFIIFLVIYALVLAGIFAIIGIHKAGKKSTDNDAKTVAKSSAFMDELIEGFDYDFIESALQTYEQNPVVTASEKSLEEHAAYFADMAQGKLTYSESELNSDTMPVYDIMADGKRLAVAALDYDGGWKLGKITFDTNTIDYKTVKLSVTSTATVTVNGEILDASAVQDTSDDANKAAIKALEMGGSLPAYVTYTIENCIEEPEITVSDPVADALSEAVSERIYTMMNNYIMFMYNKMTFSDVSPYLSYGSEAYNHLADVATAVVWGWYPDTVEIRSQNITEYEQYSENLFSCKYTATVYKADDEMQETEEFTYRMLFVQSEGNWYLTYFVLE